MDLSYFLGPSGSLAQQFPGYEHRPQQVEMAETVQAAFETPRHLIIEAGTGVGKSFAYLIPAILFSVQTGERVIVSTHTISLQEQLILRDIPALQEILPIEFKAVLAKGRGNYLSKRRLKSLLASERVLFDTKEETKELQLLETWVETTEDGSLADLPTVPRPDLWERVRSESDNCLRRECPTYKECFYYQAQAALDDANIIVTNHHLLLTDLALRRINPYFAVLPPYEYAVLDEAHQLEGVATEHIGVSLSNATVKRLLDGLVHPTREAGLFHRFKRPSGVNLTGWVRDEANRQFQAIFDWAEKRSGFDEGTGSYVGRMNQPGEIPNLLDGALESIEAELQSLRRAVNKGDESEEVASYWRRCGTLRRNLRTILEQSEPGQVYWAELRRSRRRRVALHAAPISVAGELNEHLYAQAASIVMTSATLATNQNFEYLCHRVGLQNAGERIVGSPFDYRSQVTLVLPRSMPDPRSREFVSAAVEKIRRYVTRTRGRAFVLFTSYRMLNEAYELLAPHFEQMGIRTFKQGGELARHEMLDEFRRDVSSVLLGTASFWEGVDVRGESLSNVIITKLPFSVPTHPVVEARIRAIEEQGLNAFNEYTLPEAILRFKQGFGRLIRSQTDRGIVVVLDPRIRTKYYGRQFLASLPDCRIVVE